MEFEFDPAKSEANEAKRGIDFVEAQRLWLDLNAAVYPTERFGEKRSALVAKLYGKTWTAVYIRRNRAVRIISVRRSRTKEIALYENA